MWWRLTVSVAALGLAASVREVRWHWKSTEASQRYFSPAGTRPLWRALRCIDDSYTFWVTAGGRGWLIVRMGAASAWIATSIKLCGLVRRSRRGRIQTLSHSRKKNRRRKRFCISHPYSNHDLDTIHLRHICHTLLILLWTDSEQRNNCQRKNEILRRFTLSNFDKST